MPSLSTSTRPALALTIAGLALATLAGCSTSPHVLARVGDRTISVAQYKEVAAGFASRYFLPPDTARALLLDDLVRRELLLVAASRGAVLPDSYVVRRRTEFENDALSRALLEQLTLRDVGVSDAEVRRLYVWRQQATHCRVALTTDSAAAHAARHAIDAGQDFGSVAMQFDVTGSLPPGGDLGFVQPGALVNPLDRIVRESPIGAVVGPVEAPGLGWFIVKIVAREAREQGPFEGQSSQLRSMLEQRKQRMALMARYADLSDEYRITPDPGGIDLLYRRLNAAGQLQSFGADLGATQLTPAERATIVGRWDGGPRFAGRLTVGEALDDLNNGRGGRLLPTRLDTYVEWVRGAILQRVAILEARRRHLDQEPATAERIRQSVDELLLQTIYQNEVLKKADPTDAEVRLTYLRNAGALAEFKSVGVQYVTLPESALAVRAAERATNAGTLKDAFAAAPGAEVREATIRFPTQDPLWKALEPGLRQQEVRGLLGPIRTAEGWRVVQIVARDAPVPTFEALSPQVQDGLRQQARELAAERRLRQFTDSLRAVTPVTVDRALLRRIPWPAPSGLPMPTGMPGS